MQMLAFSSKILVGSYIKAIYFSIWLNYVWNVQQVAIAVVVSEMMWIRWARRCKWLVPLKCSITNVPRKFLN